MATDSDAVSVHRTLVAATADTITITGFFEAVDVEHRGSQDTIWVRVGNVAAPPLAAVAAAKGTRGVAPGTAKRFLVPSNGQAVVSVISAGTPDYSVEGVQTK